VSALLPLAVLLLAADQPAAAPAAVQPPAALRDLPGFGEVRVRAPPGARRGTTGPEKGRGGAPWADAIAAAARKMEDAATPAAPVHAAPQAVPEVKDLPVVEVPTQVPGKRFAILVSGDGGWVGLDRGVGGALAEAGVPVVGLDSLRYFWRKKTPDQTARDVARLVAHYRALWGRDEVILVGYSRGADIVPFLPARMPEPERQAVKLVAMLAPGTFAEFEVHVIDLFSSVKRSDATSTEQAVRTLGGIHALCVRGAEENDSLCPHLADLGTVKQVVLPGAHHFDRDWPALARIILDAAPAE
jgi:type IV secretory pathway VirJ component